MLKAIALDPAKTSYYDRIALCWPASNILGISDKDQSDEWLSSVAMFARACVGPRAARVYYHKLAETTPTASTMSELAKIQTDIANEPATLDDTNVPSHLVRTDGWQLDLSVPVRDTLLATMTDPSGQKRVLFRGPANGVFPSGRGFAPTTSSALMGVYPEHYADAPSSCPDGMIDMPAMLYMKLETFYGDHTNNNGTVNHQSPLGTQFTAQVWWWKPASLVWTSNGCAATRTYNSAPDALTFLTEFYIRRYEGETTFRP